MTNARDADFGGLVQDDLAAFATQGNDLLSSMILQPSGIMPHAALILLTTTLVPIVELPTVSPSPIDHLMLLPATANLSTSEILDQSMPVLGSALNGLAVEAGVAWVWTLVKRMCDKGEYMDDMTVEMLIEVSSVHARLS